MKRSLVFMPVVETHPHHDQAPWPSPPNRDVVDHLRLAASGQFRIVFLTLAEAGMGVNEIMRLRWKDLELARSVVHVRQLNRPPREVPLGSRLVETLEDHRRSTDYSRPQHTVLTSPTGKQWAPSRFSREWKSLCWMVAAEHGVSLNDEDVLFPLSHLRRHAVALWREQGMSYKDICGYMGRLHVLTPAFARETFNTSRC